LKAASAVARNPRWRCVSNVGRRFKTKRVEQSLRFQSGKVGYAADPAPRCLRMGLAVVVVFLDHPEVPPDNTKLNGSLCIAASGVNVRFAGGSRARWTGFAQTAATC